MFKFNKKNDFEKDLIKEMKRTKRKERIDKCVNWVKNNPQEALIGGSLIVSFVGGLTKTGNKLIKAHNINKENDLKQRRIYDRSLGKYVVCNRAISNKEGLEIENRKQSGEKLHNILRDMGLI